jgi:hypothetical protein
MPRPNFERRRRDHLGHRHLRGQPCASGSRRWGHRRCCRRCCDRHCRRWRELPEREPADQHAQVGDLPRDREQGGRQPRPRILGKDVGHELHLQRRLFIEEYSDDFDDILCNKCDCEFCTNPFEFDMYDEYKGTRLYAVPDFAKTEHSVLNKKFYNKGLTMCQIRLFLKRLKTRLSDKYHRLYLSLKCHKLYCESDNPLFCVSRSCLFLTKIKLMNDIEPNPGLI